jgi:hypothetical protein
LGHPGEDAGQLRGAGFHGDGDAFEVGFAAGQGLQGMEGADRGALGPGGVQELQARGAAAVDGGIASAPAQAVRDGSDRGVRDGQEDEVRLVDDWLR